MLTLEQQIMLMSLSCLLGYLQRVKNNGAWMAEKITNFLLMTILR